MRPYDSRGGYGLASYVECKATLPDGKKWRNIAYTHDNPEIMGYHKILVTAHDEISFILEQRGHWGYRNEIE